MQNTAQLRASSVRYLSECDEAAFFEWLNKIAAVAHYEGKGDTLYIHINNYESIDEESLREIIALFYRYNIDLKQLKVFDRLDFAEWFRNPSAYWFAGIF